jgi:non-ribosomal peptide synthase protein (TIGR01720 family)
MRTVGYDQETEFLIDPWQQQAPVLSILDLRDFEHNQAEKILTQAVNDLSMALAPDRGQMLSGLWVLRTGVPAMLVLTIHHFSVDGVSWRILIEDLNALTSGESNNLHAKTMSLVAWSQYLSEQGKNGKRRHEEALWRSQLENIRYLPNSAHANFAQNTLAHTALITGKLSASDTEQLLRVPGIYFGGINDVLLASLGLTLSQWSREQFEYDLGDPVVMLEGHGRESDFDLSRTVGWFTTAFPLRLNVSDLGAENTPSTMGLAIQRVKESLRTLPDKGMGYGILRQLDSTSQLSQDKSCQPQILFNYLGRFESSKNQHDQWRLTQNGLTTSGDSPERLRLHLIEINAMIDQEGAFIFNVAYCKLIHNEQAINKLVSAFESMLKRMTQDSLMRALKVCHTPTDYPLIPVEKTFFQPCIDQKQLDTLFNLYPDLEDIVPLTPLQQGLAYESIALDSEANDPYHVQIVLTLTGKCSPAVTAFFVSP